MWGSIHGDIHFAAAAGDLWLPVGTNQPRFHRRFPPYLSQFRPAHRQQDLLVLRSGAVQGQRLTSPVRPPDQPFGQFVEGDQIPELAGIEDQPSHFLAPLRMMSSARRAFLRESSVDLLYHRAAGV